MVIHIPKRPTRVRRSMPLATVELTRQEVQILLNLVRARALELDRMLQNLEEQEGMDLQRHNLLKQMRPQSEAFQDLVMKLEGADASLR